MGLRNIVHRRNHKERGQLSHRKGLGLLEKKKDYVQRAADHHSKRERIKRLKEKAALKNKDEFYFGMIGAQTKNGVHIKQRSTSIALSTPLVQLLKSQDAGAVRAQLRAEQRRLSVLVQRIAPAVPGMTVGWLREPVRRDYLERSRRRVLQDAGLLLKPKPKGKGKAKENDTEGGLYAGLYADPHEGEDDFDDADGDDEEAVVGAAGRKTVWCDGIEQLRNYDKASSSNRSAGADAIDGWSDDDDDEEGIIDPDSLDRDDDLSRPRSPSRPSSSSSSSSLPSGSSSYAINDAKYYSYLLTLLSARQHRAAVLGEAAQKLELTRKLMATRGSTARNVAKKQANMAELVAQGKMTSNGLALPGNEEDDDDEGGDDDGEGKRRKLPKVFKWSKERKR